MKECPQCKRTYADETITFCLVDGAILSAPYTDVPPTVEAAPTVRLPRTTKPQVPETIPAALPSPRLPMPRSERSRSVYAMIVLALLLLGGLVTFFVLRARHNNRSQQIASANVSTPPSDGTQSADSQKRNIDTPLAAAPSPSRSPTPPKAPTIAADPKLFPSDARSIPYGSPSPGIGGGPGGGGGGAPDYNRVFNGKDVTQKARILSKPEPQYTEEARKNQITGTVVLRVVFTSGGQVTNITAVRPLPYGLTEKAMAAARQIKFVPAMKDGHAVSMYMQLEYNFNLY